MTQDEPTIGGAVPGDSNSTRIERYWTRLLERLARFSAAAYPALIVAALVFAFFTQPALRFMAIYPAFEGAATLGMGMILFRVAYQLERDVPGMLLGTAAVILGTFWLDDAIENAIRAAAANDRRCWHIEQEMLTARPRRTDLPDLFTALGCRPQSDTLAIMPSPPRGGRVGDGRTVSQTPPS